MIYKDWSLNIDFDRTVYYKPMSFVKGDLNSSRMLLNVAQDMTGLRLFVNFEMSNGTTYIEEATILTSTTASLILPSGVLSVAGMVQCQVALHDLTGRLTNAVGFYYTVADDLADGAIEASDQYPILTQLIADCNAFMNNVTRFKFNVAAGYNPGVGEVAWDATNGTLVVGLAGGNVKLQVGQEQTILVRNDNGALANGSVVAITGSTGKWPSIELADANGDLQHTYAIGLTTEAIAAKQNGFVTVQGVVNGIDTSTYLEGQALWLSETPGHLTATPPNAPSAQVFIGWVLKKAGSGSILVHPVRRQSAGEVAVTDTAEYFTGTTVEAVLAEIGQRLAAHGI